MPRSIARLTASSALSSSWYIRKRLPEPKPRIGTWIPVRPRVRLGNRLDEGAASSGPANMPAAIVSRNCRRFMALVSDAQHRSGLWFKGESPRIQHIQFPHRVFNGLALNSIPAERDQSAPVARLQVG